MIKRTYPQSIGDVLRQTLEETDLMTHLLEQRACEYWRVLVGQQLSALTTKPTVSKGVMKIGVADASLRQELTMHRSRMVRLINERFGRELISDIRFAAP